MSAYVLLSFSDPESGVDKIELRFDALRALTSEQRLVVLEGMARLAETLLGEATGESVSVAIGEPDDAPFWSVVAPSGSDDAVAAALDVVLADPPESAIELSEAIAELVPGARVGPLVAPRSVSLPEPGEGK